MVMKKYKLVSAEDDGKPRPCAFFLSDAGCRNGANCKFLHEGKAESGKRHVDATDDSTPNEKSVSSEGDHDMDRNPFDISSEGSDKKRKNPRELNNKENDAAKPSSAEPPSKKSKSQKEDKHASPTKSPQRSASVTVPTEKKAKTATFAPQISTVDFRSLNLPVSDFALASASDHAKNEDSSTEDPPEEEEVEEQSEDKSENGVLEELPLPKSTEVGRKWFDAVKKSQEHPRFRGQFDFEKLKAADNAIGKKTVWFKAQPFGDWCKNNPQAIAIDCEMCETQDPVTKKKNPNALCRVSIVDAETDEVLLNTLVKPEWPVTDHRTWINGISASDLASVQFNLGHCQAFMMALCSEETVILGHAVVNDLKAMLMEHYCVADSAYLYRAKDSETASVSLKDLCAGVLGKVMPETHDSVNDARVALCCLEHYIEKEGKVDDITRTPSNKQRPRGRQREDRSFGRTSDRTSAASKLFIHRIPKHVRIEHLSGMFLNNAKVATEEISEIEFNESSGRALATFSSPAHANLAFRSLKGDATEDPTGRLQKRVFLRDGQYIRVRKMVHERGDERHPSQGRSRTPDK